MIVLACAFPRLALAQSTPPAPVTSLSATTVSQTAIDLTWNANLTPTPTFPGTFTVFFAGAASNVAADITITGNGEMSGIDAATGTSNNAVTFDTAIDFAPGNSTVSLTKTRNGATKGTGNLDGVTGAAQGSVKAGFAPLFPRLAALRPGTTYPGGLSMMGNNSITSGGPLLVEGPLSLTGSGDIGTAAAPMIVIVRPTSANQLTNLIKMTGNGSIFGIVYVDLSLLAGNPLKLSGALLSITGNGFLSGIFAINGPSCPLTISSHMITGFTGNGGFLGGAVMQINGSLVNAQGTGTPSGSLPLVSVTGNGNVRYDSATIASAYKVVVAASAPSSFLVERATQSGGPYSQVGVATVTSFLDTGLASGTTYFYVIQAVNAAGTSPVSSQAQATTLAFPPTNVVATTVSQTQLDVTWTASFGATSYQILRGSESGGPFTPVGSVTTTSFEDSGLQSGTAYYYVVQALDAGGASGDSGQAQATTLAYPPTNVAATAVSQTQINVTWTGSFGATSYLVLRGSQSGGPYSQVGTPTGTTFQDTGLSPGTTYYYVLEAVDAGGASGNSSQALATTPPAAPAALAATAVSQTQINLSWTTSFGATSYSVFRGSQSGGPYTQIATTGVTSFQDSGLTAGTTYDYVVRAINAGGASGNSPQAQATTLPTPPTFGFTPANGSATNNTLVEIKITYNGTNLQYGTFQAQVDGSMSALDLVAFTTSAATFVPTLPLGEGQHTITAKITDSFGSTTTATSVFSVELTATHLGLAISPSDPRSVLVNSLNSLIVTALTKDNLVATGFASPIQITTTAGQATLDQLMAQFTIASQGVLTIPNVAIVLQPGPQTVTAVALASPSIQGTLTLTGVTQAPTVTPTTVNPDGSTTLTISTIPFGSFTVIVNGTVYATGQASASGTFSLTLVLPPGVNTVEVTTPTAGDSTILPLGPPQTISGLVRGGPLGGDQPLPNVPVTIVGTGASTLTAADGSFSIRNVPIGNQVVNVNASFVSSNGSSFSGEWIGVAVVSSPVFMGAIVLRPTDYAPGDAAPIGFAGTSGSIGVLTARNSNLPFVSATVGPGTLTVPSGVQPYVTVSQVSMVDLPILLPPPLASSQFISVGPEGATIDGPLTMTFPNADGVPPNGTTPLWHYSPTLGSWVIAGMAKADNFGTTLTTDPLEFGIYATQAPKAVQTTLLLAVVDENEKLLAPDPLSLQVFGSSVTGLSFLPLVPPPGPLPIVAGANVELVFTVPSFPYSAMLRITRAFPDGASATVTYPVTLSQSSTQVVRIGHPANLSGTVVAEHNQILVQNAIVTANGVTATTDQYGRFTLNNVEIFSTTAPYTDMVEVTATKFVGKTFTTVAPVVTTASAAVAPYPNADPLGQIVINADISQGPLFTATTIQRYFPPDAYGFTSLVYEPELRHFYTENVTTNQIWQADASGFVPAVNVPIAFGPAGLQRGTLSMGTSLIGAGGLWVADGHKGTVYSIFPSNPGPPLASVQVAADNLNTAWPSQVAAPLVDHFENQRVTSSDFDEFGLGDALVLFATNNGSTAAWFQVFPQTTVDLTAFWQPFANNGVTNAPGELYFDPNGGYGISTPGGTIHIANPNFIYATQHDALNQPGQAGYLFIVNPGDTIFGSGAVAVTTPNGAVAITAQNKATLGSPAPTAGQITTLYSTKDLVKTQSYPTSVNAPLSIGHLYGSNSPPPFDLGQSFGVQPIPTGQFTLTEFSPPVPGPSSGPFTPTALAFANAQNGTTILAITNDASIQGLGNGNCGTSVVAQNTATAQNLTVYTAPPGYALTGLALAPDPNTNQSSIFVLQTNQQAVVAQGGQTVEYDVVEIRPADALFDMWTEIPYACPGTGQTSNDGVANNFLKSLGTNPCSADPFGDGLGAYVHVVNTGNLGGVPITSIVRVYPQPESQGDYLDTPLYIDFTQGMRADTLSANFTLVNVGAPVTTITGTFSMILGTPSRAIFTPFTGTQLSLAPNTTYTATLVGGPGGAQELLGRYLPQTFSWTFTTGSALAAVVTDPIAGILDIEADYYGLNKGPNPSYPYYPGTTVPIAVALCGFHDSGVAGIGSGPGGKGIPGGPPPDDPNPVTETPPVPDPTIEEGTFAVLAMYPPDGSQSVLPSVTPSVLFNGPVALPMSGLSIALVTSLEGVVPTTQTVDPFNSSLVNVTPNSLLVSGVTYALITTITNGISVVTSQSTFIPHTVSVVTSEVPSNNYHTTERITQNEISEIHDPTTDCPCPCGCDNDGGDMARLGWFWTCLLNGSFIVDPIDFKVRGRGLDTIFERTYRSNVSFSASAPVTFSPGFTDGMLGPNWHVNLDRRFVTNGDGSLTFITEDGLYYTFPIAMNQNLVGNVLKRWTAGPGFYQDIELLGPTYVSGGQVVLQRERRGGTRFYYGPYSVQGVTVWRLIRVEDSNQNAIVFNRDSSGVLQSFLDTIGRTTTFTYYGANGTFAFPWQQGKLFQVKDHIGRVWTYSYTPQTGELASVETPATDWYDFDDNGNLIGPTTSPKITDYTYDNSLPLPHLLKTMATRVLTTGGVFAPTVAPVRVTYDPTTGRVSQVDNGKGTSFFAFDFASRKVTFIDRAGNVNEVDHDANGDISHSITFSKQLRGNFAPEPTGYTSVFTHDVNNELIEWKKPAGNFERWIYDQANGTLLQHILRDPSGKNPLITDMEYEPIFHQIRRVTEPRGNNSFTNTIFGQPQPQNPSPTLVTVTDEVIAPVTSPALLQTSAANATQRDAFSTYLFYDHEDLSTGPNSAVTTVQKEMQVVGQWTPQPGLQSFGRVPATSPDANVFVDLDGDGILDRGGNLYVVRGPRAQGIDHGASTASWSQTGPQDIQSRSAYNSFGQEIFTVAPDGYRVRQRWNTDPYDLATNPDAGYRLLEEDATKFQDTDLNPDFASTDFVTGTPTGTASGSGLNLQHQFHYTPCGSIRSSTDPLGNTTTFKINAMSLVTAIQGPAPFNYTHNFFYDSRNNKIQVQVPNVVPLDEGSGVQNGASQQTDLGFFDNFFHFNSVNDLVSSDADARGSPNPRLITIYQYDLKQRLVAVEQGEGNVHTTVWDERDLVVETVGGKSDPLTAQAFRFAFDANGNLTQKFNDDGGMFGVQNHTIMIYDVYDRLLRTTDELGNYTDCVLDASGFPVDCRRVDLGTNLLARKFSFFDEAGRLFQTDVEFFDPAGNAANTKSGLTQVPAMPPVTQLPMGVSSPANRLVHSLVKFDVAGKVMIAANDNAHLVTLGYDLADRPTSMTDNLGSSVVSTLDDDGLVIRSAETDVATDPLLSAQTFYTENFYDSEYRLIQRVSNLGNTTRLLYDSRNNVTQVSDALAAPNGQTVGALSRPDSPIAAVALNGRGNTTRFRYDGASRLLETDRDLRQGGTGDGVVSHTIATKNEWDRNSRLKTQTDDNQNVTEYCYDDQNRLIMTHYANGTRRDLVWVDNVTRNRLSTLKLDRDARNVTRVYDYDAAKRRVKMTVAGATGVSGPASVPPGDPSFQTTSEAWQWDGVDRMTQAQSFALNQTTTPATQVTRQYDSMSNMVAESEGVLTTTGTLNFMSSNQHDGVGNRTVVNYPSAPFRLGQVFDAIDRLQEIDDTTTATTVLAKYQHAGMGSRVTTRQSGNGTTLTRRYDGDRRVSVHEHGLTSLITNAFDADTTAFRQFIYAWDRANNRRSETDASLGTGSFYVYDSAYRLVQDLRGVQSGSLPNLGTQSTLNNLASLAVPAGGPGTHGTVYQLDGANNRQAVNADGAVASLTLNTFKSWTPSTTQELPPPGAILADSDMNQYSQVSSQAGTQNLTYDFAGNQTSDSEMGEQRYFDCYDRLVQVVNTAVTPTTDTRYRYDAVGRRLSKTIFKNGAAAPSVEIVFVRDGWETLEEWDSGAFAKRFVYGEKEDEPIRMTVQGAATDYWYHDNSIGSIVALTNNAGGVIEQYTYKAYGELDAINGGATSETAIGNPFYFQGRRRDFEEASAPGRGLMYFRARYYDPALGRFISRDPKGVWGSVSSLGNAQCAFGNNPVNMTDPFGRDSILGQVWDATLGKATGVSSDDIALAYHVTVGTVTGTSPEQAADVTTAVAANVYAKAEPVVTSAVGWGQAAETVGGETLQGIASIPGRLWDWTKNEFYEAPFSATVSAGWDIVKNAIIGPSEHVVNAKMATDPQEFREEAIKAGLGFLAQLWGGLKTAKFVKAKCPPLIKTVAASSTPAELEALTTAEAAAVRGAMDDATIRGLIRQAGGAARVQAAFNRMAEALRERAQAVRNLRSARMCRGADRARRINRALKRVNTVQDRVYNIMKDAAGDAGDPDAMRKLLVLWEAAGNWNR
jgi:RHS repeat-associated protein